MKLFRKRINKIMKKFEGKNLILYSRGANFFGQESKGLRQLRGNGVLVLLEEKLFFEMWTPRKGLEIPIKSIIEVTTPKSHLKKTVFRPLLKITFQNKENENDSAAWWVKDLDKWVTAIGSLKKNI